MKKLILPLLFTAIFFTSCESSKMKNEASWLTKEFFRALKTEDKDKLKAMYSGMEHMGSYYRSDSITITSTNYSNDIVSVGVHNRANTLLGKVIEKDIYLFFKKDEAGKLTLFDSKGLMALDEDEMSGKVYSIETSAGCINKNVDTTDQLIIMAMQHAKPVLQVMMNRVNETLQEKLVIRNWTWEKLFGTGVGKGTVCNGRSVVMHALKYKVTFMDAQKNEISTKNGYLTYEDLAPGECRSFSVLASDVDGASSASIEPVFEDELIINTLVGIKWKGTECADIRKQLAEQ